VDFDKCDDVLDRLRYLEGVYRSKKDQRDSTAKGVSDLEEEGEVLLKTEKVLKHLVEKLAKKDLTKMDKLVTWGLNTVFPGRDIKFETELVERGNKIKINLKTLHNGKLVDADNKSSISVVESFLLRILCIAKLQRAPLLLMDETFGAVGSEYIENISKLISKLSEKLGIDILLVTHNPAFQAHSGTSFKLTSDENEVKIESIR
jgi:ABC-type nitrate/sulfonate/bicarbonate transport system ATPase subunit